MTDYPRDREYERLDKMPRVGMWNWHNERVFIRCPNGHVSSCEGHTIIGGGKVAPSVVCGSACGFHEYLRLLGWDEAANG